MNGWTATKDRLPEEGQEVTVRMNHGQIAQVVKDSHYNGGWKQVNCQGWEMVTWHADSITHWRPEVFERPSKTGPKDAPWMTPNAKSEPASAELSREVGSTDGLGAVSPAPIFGDNDAA